MRCVCIGRGCLCRHSCRETPCDCLLHVECYNGFVLCSLARLCVCWTARSAVRKTGSVCDRLREEIGERLEVAIGAERFAGQGARNRGACCHRTWCQSSLFCVVLASAARDANRGVSGYD